MNILGIGIDATDIPRIADAYGRHGARFLRRIFTEAEIAYCTARRDPVPHLAARFAAKEAARKALGTGYSPDIRWTDFEVARGDGAPRLHLHGAAARQAEAMKVERSLITLTHSERVAFAQVMLIGG